MSSIIIVTGRVTADPVMQRIPELNTSVWGLLPTREVKAERKNPSSISVTATSFLQID